VLNCNSTLETTAGAYPVAAAALSLLIWLNCSLVKDHASTGSPPRLVTLCTSLNLSEFCIVDVFPVASRAKKRNLNKSVKFLFGPSGPARGGGGARRGMAFASPAGSYSGRIDLSSLRKIRAHPGARRIAYNQNFLPKSKNPSGPRPRPPCRRAPEHSSLFYPFQAQNRRARSFFAFGDLVLGETPPNPGGVCLYTLPRPAGSPRQPAIAGVEVCKRGCVEAVDPTWPGRKFQAPSHRCQTSLKRQAPMTKTPPRPSCHCERSAAISCFHAYALSRFHGPPALGVDA